MVTEKDMAYFTFWFIRMAFSWILIKHAAYNHLSIATIVLFFPDIFLGLLPELGMFSSHKPVVTFFTCFLLFAALAASLTSVLWFSWFCENLLMVSIASFSSSPLVQITLLEFCYNAYVVFYLAPKAINTFGKTYGLISDEIKTSPLPTQLVYDSNNTPVAREESYSSWAYRSIFGQ